MSRSMMLEKIRRACRQAEKRERPSELPRFPDFEDRVVQFQQELELVGGTLFDARRSEKLADILSQILKLSGTTEIHWEGPELFQKHGLPFTERNPKAFDEGLLVYSYHFRQTVELPLLLSSKRCEPDELERVILSASSARFGVAETGTIVHEVGVGTGRVLSVIPPNHVAFLCQKDLLDNHAQLFATLRPGENGSALTLITGPSRTADIEKTLVTGVHGPKQWFVILTL